MSLLLLGAGVRPVAGGGGATDPPATGDMVLWLRDDSIVKSGSNLSGWTDKSGNGNNFSVSGTVPVTAVGPGGADVIDMTNDSASGYPYRASLSLSQPFSIVAVFKRTSSAFQAGMICFSSDAAVGIQAFYGADLSLFAGSFLESSSDYGDDTWRWCQGDFNGASSALYVNGTSVASGNPGSAAMASEFRIGTNDEPGEGHLGGEIAELIIWDKVLSSGERADLASYMSSYWGLS